MFRKNMDSQVYEYVYLRRTYRRSLWLYFGIWVAILIIRATAYAIWGMEFSMSGYNLLSLGISGILVGMFVHTVRVLKKSTRIGEVDNNTGSLDIGHISESSEGETK